MTPVTRRRFITGSTATLGLTVLAAGCSGGNGGGTGATTDLDTATTIGRLEKLASDTYVAVRLLVTTGKLGAAMPPAMGTLLITAVGQHDAALAAWNKVLDDAGRAKVESPEEKLRTAVDAAMVRVADVVAAATLVVRLEDLMSQTYQRAIPALTSADLVTLAARINVVGQQRQAVLRYMLGLYPVGSGTGMADTDIAPADPKVSLLTG